MQSAVDNDHPRQLDLLAYTAWNDTIGHVDASHRHNCHGVLPFMNGSEVKYGASNKP